MIYHEFFFGGRVFLYKTISHFLWDTSSFIRENILHDSFIIFSVTDHMLWINCYGSTVCSLPLKVYSVPCTFSGGSIRNARFMAFSSDRT